MSRISEFFGLNEEQSRILSLPRRAAVRAGAGSGKTTAIIARYLDILEAEKADIHQIVVITFTENAAAELKSRTTSKIEEYVDTYGCRGNINKGCGRKFFSAPIKTIHGFCSSILRENSLELGLPSAFSVIEGSEKKDFDEKNIRRFILAKIGENDPAVRRLLEMESHDCARIEETMLAILKDAGMLHLVPPFRYCGESGEALPEPGFAYGRFRAALENYLSVLPTRSAKRKKTVGDLAAKIDMAEDIGPNMPHLNAIHGQIKTSVKTVEVENARQDLLGKVFSMTEPYNSEMNSLHLDLSGEAYRFLEDTRISEGKIEYEDMVRLTVELLKKNPEMLDYYRRYFKFIIVDEFQDTDSLQLELLELLTTEGGSGNSLLVVGDLNQSIYGFRGAQPEIFDGVVGNKEFEKAFLTTNYRSSRSLVEFFNAFFADTFPRGQYENMKSGRADSGPGVAPEFIASASGEKKGPAKKAKEFEARRVASKIKEIQEECSGEIALLFSHRNHMSVYEKALEREGIRFQSGIGRSFYGSQEVRDVMSMLRYFLDPQDPLAAASVLRSPYFGASDDELFSFFRTEEEGKSSRIGEYLGFLDEKRKDCVDGDVFRAVDFAVNGLGYSSAVRALPESAAKLVNLRKLLLIAERLVSQKGYGLCQVVERFDSMRRSEEDQVFEETDEDKVVKLMTVHGSKGLEFDTVFLCDTNYRGARRSGRVMADIEKGFVVRYPAFPSDIWEEIKSRVEEKEDEEEKRLLYVAMTRAKKRLFICVSGRLKTGKENEIAVEKGSFADILRSASYLSSLRFEEPEGTGEDEEKTFFSHLSDGTVPEESGPAGDSSSGEKVPFGFDWITPLYSEKEKPAAVFKAPDLFSQIDPLKDSERAGSVMHRFLETWDFRRETAEREIRFVLAEFLAENSRMEELLRKLSSNFLSSELLAVIQKARKIERELKFVVFDAEEGVPKRGRIDLLTEEDGGVRLFDYKYRESIDDTARETYEKQMDTYKKAVASRFKKPLLSRHIVLIPKVELVSI